MALLLIAAVIAGIAVGAAFAFWEILSHTDDPTEEATP